METLVLTRIKSNKYGTFGLLMLNDVLLCHTLELPWKDNQSRVSCIPTGTYDCTGPRTSKKFNYHHYLVHGVKDRFDVLIHRGNWISDSHGCLLVGMLANDKGIEKSKIALEMLMKKFPKGFKLIIKDEK